MREKIKTYDVIIIGSGPAGMTAAIYASRAELKVLLLEAGVPGGKMALTTEIENWPGNKMIAGSDLAVEMHEHASAFGAEYVNDSVKNIIDNGAWKRVEGLDGCYEAKAVIIASGTVERHLGIPGEKELYGLGVSYCAVCDGAFFRSKPVVVIGGGNTAFEDALYLTRYASQVTLVTRRTVARADRTNQKRLAENPKITWLRGYKPLEILAEGGVVSGLRLKESEGDQELLLKVAGVFPMVGLDPKTDFIHFPDFLDSAGFIPADAEMATSLPGIFAAGDVCRKLLRQIVTATSDGCIAAQSAARYLDGWSERFPQG